MKNLFLIVLLLLLGFTQYITFRTGKLVKPQEGVPVIHWVTDPNPVRPLQVALFYKWLERHNYPKIRVEFDYANQGIQKTVVQGVTGVAGDLIDVQNSYVPYLKEIGILQDVSGVTKELGLPDVYNPKIHGELFVDGKRYGFPRSLSMAAFFVNRDLFRKLGMEPPPYRWDFATFEKIGAEFNRRANPGSKREYFFTDAIQQAPFVLRRSLGVSYFNECLTRSAVNDARTARSFAVYKKWRDEMHLFPTPAESSSFVGEQGLGTAAVQLFNKGYFGMLSTGRHTLIPLRTMKCNFDLSASEHPNGGYPNAFLGCTVVVLYKGSPNREWAKYFLAFLESEEYNHYIIEDADTIPPVPSYYKTEAYARPKKYPNEWALHQNLARAADEIGVSREYSPFTLKVGDYLRAETKIFDGFMTGVYSAEKAAELLAQTIDKGIEESLKDHPELKEKYAAAEARQKQIDAIKAKGGKIPLALVDNTFLKKYYQDTGLGE